MKSMLLAAIICFIANMTLAQGSKLLMFEQDGCYWCEIWDDEISEIYPKTLEGSVAPLQRIDIHSTLSTEITLKSSPQFTPTFIIVNNNIEVGRIEGYPGEDFFWGLIDKILLEDDLFKLELDAFMRLIETNETQDRIKHTLATGKPLIN